MYNKASRHSGPEASRHAAAYYTFRHAAYINYAIRLAAYYTFRYPASAVFI
jgi:hypothetical protein